MFTVTKVVRIIGGKELIESVCLSSDTKLNSFANGSMCLEMNTGDVYAFNEDDSAWVKVN